MSKQSLKFVGLLIAVVAMALLQACDPTQTGSSAQQCKISDANVAAQMEVAKSNAAAQIEVQKRCTALQLEVLKRCADQGNIPVFINGNIDCKPAPPRARPDAGK